MKTLVTGAAGFIGSHVVAALREQGEEPVALVRPGADTRDLAGVEVVEADYADEAAARVALRSVAPSAVVHTAWRVAPGSEYLHDPANIDHLRASLRLFPVAAEEGCRRIVGIGTCLEYGDSGTATAEDAPLRPTTLYGASKAALFTAADAWAGTIGLSFAWARLYYPFGPREAPHRLVPAVTNALLRGERIATTAGDQRRSFLYVEDVARAIAAIATSDTRGPVNVGAPEAIPIRELLERLARLLRRPDLLDVGALPARPGDPAVLCPDVAKLETVVGWRPRTGLDEGLERTVEWWRSRAGAQ